tara:strand:+ start:1555 stop:1968 length:414 start_codon:yes stop_codon:yes gene_type:complete
MVSDSIKEGDLVVVVGSTTKRDEPTQINHMIAKIVAVGKSDVFAIDIDLTYRRHSAFSVPISRCIRIDDSAIKPLDDIAVPKLGDLVMSIVDRFGKHDKKIGVLTEIVDVPGRCKMGRLLQGETAEVVSLDSMIVLE